jgi:prefoldin subunit 5
MEIEINNINEEQDSFIQNYKRINKKLEVLQQQMTRMQNEAQSLITELENLRDLETKTFKNGKK